jgi:hypothetical protein
VPHCVANTVVVLVEEQRRKSWTLRDIPMIISNDRVRVIKLEQERPLVWLMWERPYQQCQRNTTHNREETHYISLAAVQSQSIEAASL